MLTSDFAAYVGYVIGLAAGFVLPAILGVLFSVSVLAGIVSFVDTAEGE